MPTKRIRTDRRQPASTTRQSPAPIRLNSSNVSSRATHSVSRTVASSTLPTVGASPSGTPDNIALVFFRSTGGGEGYPEALRDGASSHARTRGGPSLSISAGRASAMRYFGHLAPGPDFHDEQDGPIVDLVYPGHRRMECGRHGAKSGNLGPRASPRSTISVPPEALVTKARLLQGSHKPPHECSGGLRRGPEVVPPSPKVPSVANMPPPTRWNAGWLGRQRPQPIEAVGMRQRGFARNRRPLWASRLEQHIPGSRLEEKVCPVRVTESRDLHRPRSFALT